MKYDFEGLDGTGCPRHRYIGMDGRPVKKTKFSDPYSYDEFVLMGDSGEKYNHAKYSDRLMQWDFKKHERCLEKVFGDKGQIWSNRSFNQIEEFLKLYFEEESIALTMVVEGCNNSNGYPYWVFFYNQKAEEL